MTKINTYSAKGIKGTQITLPKMFSGKENMPLLAQAIKVYEARSHTGSSKTKTRGEVRASKVKIWRQKGTGRARHGAVSAPIFVGGGQAHGPKGVKRELSLPKKMKQKALSLALSLLAKEGRIVGVTNISLLKKTKEAKSLLDKIIEKEAKEKKIKKILIALSKDKKEAERVFRNLPNVNVALFGNLNAHNVYFSDFLVLDKDVVTKKEKKTGSVKSDTAKK